MKYLFLLLLLIIISISLVVFRNNVTVEKYSSFSNKNCIYTDKIELSGGGYKPSDCSGSETCQSTFEENADCIKNNFIDTRCKLIKIWYAKKVQGTDSYYTFSKDNTHIIQMKRDATLNCQQFGSKDSVLIKYLNDLLNIENNESKFDTEEALKTYNKSEKINNKDTKLIIGYAYAANDKETREKTLAEMKYCVNMNSDSSAFGKEYLKDTHKTEVIFNNPTINSNKTLNTGRVIVNRFIKKIDDGYKIIYKIGDIEISSTTELPDMSKTCNHLFLLNNDKPDLWILHTSDEKYHRVNFNEQLTDEKTICDKISNPSDPAKSIVINPDVVKTEAELELINYVPVDEDTKDVFELGFNFSDMTIWFEVDGSNKITSEESLSVCSNDQYESVPPQSQIISQNGSDVTIYTSDRTCTPLAECTAWNIVMPPEKKDVLNSTGETVKINSTDRQCQPINLGDKSPENHFIKNYQDVHIGYNKFSGELEFDQLSNCLNNRQTKQYVANWEDFNNSNIKIGGKVFHTINRDCRPLDSSQCDDKYISNADHFQFDYRNYNHNNVHSNLDCQPLNYCGSNQYFNHDEFLKTKINFNDKNIYTKDISDFCINQPVCRNDQYIANVEELNRTKRFDMFTKPFDCQNLTKCDDDTYETAEPEIKLKFSDPLKGFFVKNRVCSALNSCEAHINIEVNLRKAIDVSIYDNTETRKIKEFNNAYFVDRTDDTEFDYKNLNFFTCEGIRVKYEVEVALNPRNGYNNDVPQFRTRPKFILKKKSKEVVAMIQLDIKDNAKIINLELSDTDETKTNTFKKFPNDIFELYLDTGSCKNMTIKIEDFVFNCKRNQYIHQKETDNVCKYEHPDIGNCANNKYYDLTLSPENEEKSYLYKESGAYCIDYNDNDCRISDKSISCGNTDDSYNNEGINASYKQLYNDTLSYDTTNECASKCTDRKGCGAFKINAITNICDYYGFETVKIEIANIDINKFNIKYNTDDDSESEVTFNKGNTTISKDNIITKTFSNPVHIKYLTIESKDSAKITDLPDDEDVDVYIKFYYYDNSYKSYTKSPTSGSNHEVDIDSYIRTDKLLEIHDIYYIPIKLE